MRMSKDKKVFQCLINNKDTTYVPEYRNCRNRTYLDSVASGAHYKMQSPVYQRSFLYSVHKSHRGGTCRRGAGNAIMCIIDLVGGEINASGESYHNF